MRRALLVTGLAISTLGAVVIAGPVMAATGVTTPGPAAGISSFMNNRAGNGPGDGTGAGAGAGMMQGRMSRGGAGGYGINGSGINGSGAMGYGQGTGDCTALVGSTAQGTLTPEQKTRLAGMAEEEKLAHDVYVALAASTGDARFTRIATAETRHLEQVRALLTRYGITDPTAGKAAGQFTSTTTATLYRDLVAKGTVSLDAALGVGRTIETLDITDLAKATTGVTAPDVTSVYAHLTAGSKMHLRAFGG
jgi:hypothetical protein